MNYFGRDTNKKRYPGLYSLRSHRTDDVPVEGSFSRGIPAPAEKAKTTMSSIQQQQGRSADVLSTMSSAASMLGGALGKKKPDTEVSATKQAPTEAWGGKKFAGNMTTDQFVSLAGALSQAVAPDTAMGRMGGVLSQYGQRSVAKRERQEESAQTRLQEREALRTKSLLDIGKEERGYGFEREKAGWGLSEFEAEQKAKGESATTLREHQTGLQRMKDVAAKERAEISAKTKTGEKPLTKMQKITVAQKTQKSVADQLEAEGIYDTKAGEGLLRKNYLTENTKMETIPDYKPSPKKMVRSRTTPSGEVVFFNMAGEAFRDEAGKKPYMSEGGELPSTERGVRRFKVTGQQ